MIRCVRIWTGEDSDSLFEEGTIDLPKGERGDVLTTPGLVVDEPPAVSGAGRILG